ncbi:MAG: NAD(P)/FAD-dependent oxidoreductase [Clostridia bacterium]
MGKYDIIVIGAGAAGLMASIVASENGKKVLVFERNEKLGRKIRITGKGRCNVCNNCTADEFISHVPGNGKFMFSAINTFTPDDTMNFFEKLNVPLKTERGGRVFPVSDNAHDIADALANRALKNGVIFQKSTVDKIVYGEVKTVISNKIEYKADNILIATGGASYKATGSTGDGYKFAKSLGHTVKEPRASLVALTSDDKDCADMQGLSLRNCGLKLYLKNKCVFEDFGEMLFTHFGVSGPIVLSSSAHIRKDGDYYMNLDLKPALSVQQLDNRLLRDFESSSNRNFDNYLKELLPSKMISVMINRVGISGDTKCHSITREQRHNLISNIKSFKINISGFRPINEAIITSGGVNIKEVNPKTMESKIAKGIYFAGEVIDVDAYTGGFNLQIAFSTGYLAGISMGE